MLPDKDGLEVCRSLRNRGIKTPILMLTGLSAVDERVSGLNAGADDYLGKPFSFEELVARIRALMRRGEAGEAARLRYADVEIDLVKRAVTRAGQPIKLRNKEYELLEFFMRRHDRVLQRTTIAEHVWDMNYDLGSNVIDVYVAALRRKLDKDFDVKLIHTIIGVGYMFSTEGPFA
jgi:two-component system copper resistance phosphate regulon response regulator CusR